MAASTLLYIILAGMIALGAALFFYFYKAKRSGRIQVLLSILRFISLFAVLLLLINPTFKQTTYTTLKPKLVLAVDNSQSIKHLGYGDQLKNTLKSLQDNAELNKRFDVDTYTFGSELKANDSIDFSETKTNISETLEDLYSIYKNQTFAPVLITDGNANAGGNYSYTAQEHSDFPHYFIAAGDTTRYEDLSIDRINVNKYAYLKNRFPVELVLAYTGNATVTTTVSILKKGQTVFKQKLQFSEEAPAKRINTYLESSGIGSETYNVVLSSIPEEKNTTNNSKSFGIEVIDQRSKVLIVYSVLHPDLGTLKKSIETNQLRTVDIKSISEIDTENLTDYNLVVLFEPTKSFAKVYTQLEKLNLNRFTIVGSNTDRAFVNKVQNSIRLPLNREVEEAQPVYNTSFSSFQIGTFDASNYPPLEVLFGETELTVSADVIFNQKIAGIDTTNPLLAVFDSSGRREVVLLGTGIFQWRSQTYLDSRSFESFDVFIEKLVQYAASDTKRKRLQVAYERFYYGGSGIAFRAQFFDKNYVFDNRADLELQLKNKETGASYETPMVLNSGSFKAALPNLEPGNYQFEVLERESNTRSTGSFTVIAYNIENQVVNADYSQLKTAAEHTGGLAVTLDKPELLIDKLLDSDRYVAIERASVKNVPLVHFVWLLLLIVAALTAEWFIRKYNGLL